MDEASRVDRHRTATAQSRNVDEGGFSLDRVAAGLVWVLRRAGVPVPMDATLRYVRALGEVGFDRPEHVYWAGRATLVRRFEDIEIYDRAFVAFFGSVDSPGPVRPSVRSTGELILDTGAEDEAGSEAESDHRERPPADVRAVMWSWAEVLRHKDLATCSPDELDEAHRMVAMLRTRAEVRPSRRYRPHHGRGRPDLRRSVRDALRTDGEVLQIAARRPGHRARRLVLIVDVSGSMEPYARALLRFGHAAVAARRHGEVEVFALGTRLTRVTRSLISHDPDQALREATLEVPDWAGGTRLGDGLAQFNDHWGVRGLARGSTVAILSDGWDRGDPEVLAAEMARLTRVAHRLVWVNPLKAAPGYAPLAQGMAAALPYVDEFVEGHSVASLEQLARLVAGSGPGTRSAGKSRSEPSAMRGAV